jgi:hypothetical protein
MGSFLSRSLILRYKTPSAAIGMSRSCLSWIAIGVILIDRIDLSIILLCPDFKIRLMDLQLPFRGLFRRRQPYVEVNDSDEADEISLKAQRNCLSALIFSIAVNIILSCAVFVLLARYRGQLASDASLLKKASAYCEILLPPSSMSH